jgi:hypothetical protein
MMRTSKPEEEDEDKKLKLTVWKKAFLYQLPKNYYLSVILLE